MKSSLKPNVKVHILWEGHIVLRNLHLTFVLCSASQKLGEDFAKNCGLLRIYELYELFQKIKRLHISYTIVSKSQKCITQKIARHSSLIPIYQTENNIYVASKSTFVVLKPWESKKVQSFGAFQQTFGTSCLLRALVKSSILPSRTHYVRPTT